MSAVTPINLTWDEVLDLAEQRGANPFEVVDYLPMVDNPATGKKTYPETFTRGVAIVAIQRALQEGFTARMHASKTDLFGEGPWTPRSAVGIELRCPGREGPQNDRWAIFLTEPAGDPADQDVSPDRSYRVTFFDTRGFSGHRLVPNTEEALDEVLRDGYREADPGALNRLHGTPELNPRHPPLPASVREAERRRDPA